MSLNLGSATAYLMLDTSDFDRGIATASKQLTGFNKEGATAGDKIQSVGNSMQTVGKTMTKNVTVPLLAAGTAIWKVSSDFESGMANVRQLSGETGENFDSLSAKAREMGATTEFSATQATEALGYMALAGWDANDMMAGLAPVMDLATVSGEDLSNVSDILTDAITAFGHTAHDQTDYVDEFGNSVNYAEHFADILATTSAKSNTTVGMLGDAFKYCAPAAGALGYEAEDVALALGVMANQGIKASQGGTALRRLLLNMIDPSDDAAAVMNKYNLSLFNADESAKDFGTVLDELRDVFKGTGKMTEEQVAQMAELDDQFQNSQITEEEYNTSAQELIKTFGLLTDSQLTSAAAALVGATGLSGFLAIVNSSDEDFNKFRRNIDECNGSVTEMAGIMRETSEVQLKILLSALSELAISLGDTLVPIIVDVIKWITSWVDKFNQLDPSIKEIIVKVGLFIAAAGPIISVIGKIVSLCGTVVGWIGSIIGIISGGGGLLGVLGSLGTTLGSIFSSIFAFVAANPVVLLIAAIIAAIAGLVVAIVKNWDEIKAATQKLWDNIQEIFSKLAEWFQEKFNEAKEKAVEAWKNAREKFLEIKENIQDVFETIDEWFRDKFTKAKELVIQVWENIKDKFVEIKDKIQAVFETIDTWFKDKFESAKEKILEAWSDIKDKFNQILDEIKSVFEDVQDWFREKFTEAKDAIVEVWNDIHAKFMEIYDRIKEVFSDVGSWFKDKFNEAKEGIIEAWSDIKEKFQDKLQSIKDVFSNVKDFFSEVGRNIVNGILDGVKAAWDTLTGWISSGIDRLKNVGSSIVNGVSSAISGNSKGRYAAGLDYVKSDGLYYLHEGESVRTKEQTRNGSKQTGDTYNFYSPKALDEITAAREMRRTKQQLALGFD